MNYDLINSHFIADTNTSLIALTITYELNYSLMMYWSNQNLSENVYDFTDLKKSIDTIYKTSAAHVSSRKILLLLLMVMITWVIGIDD